MVDNRVSCRTGRMRGQAMVEFALVLPVMMLVLLIAADFGRLFFSYIEVLNAAREAANYAGLHAADNPFDQTAYEQGVTAAALGEANAQAQRGEGGLVVGTPSCFIPGTPPTPIACNAAANFAAGIGNQVSTTAQQPFTFFTPLIGGFFGGQLVLSASATAPVLNPLVATVSTTTTTASTTTASTTTTTTTTTASTTTTTTTQACVTPVVTVTPATTVGGNKQVQITVTFTATATNGPVTSWAWDFGDGATFNGANPPAHTYTYTGVIGGNGHGNGPQTWTLTLAATTTPGCTGSKTASVKLDP